MACLAALVAATFVILHTPWSFAAADAQENEVDLVAQLLIPEPRVGAPGENFTYRAHIKNLGPASADGATFQLDVGEDMTEVQVSCTGSDGGASCPQPLNVDELLNPRVTGRIETLPARGSVTLTVTGRLGEVSSVSPTLTVSAPSNVIETAPDSNTVSQQISTPVDLNIELTARQDSDVVASGQTRTYTVTYTNKGTTSSRVAIAIPYVDSYGNEGESTVKWTVSCGAGTTPGMCPTDIHPDKEQVVPENQRRLETNLYSHVIETFPAGATLELTIPITHTFQCIEGKTAHRVELRPRLDQLSSRYEKKTQVVGTVSGTQCRPIDVSVTKTQDLENVASGAERIYTVTYTNRGDAINGAYVSDSYAWINKDDVLETAVSCGAGTTAGACPEWATGQAERYLGKLSGESYSLYAKRMDLPAGATVELKVSVKHTLGRCVVGGTRTKRVNTAAFQATTRSARLSTPQVWGTLEGEQCPDIKVETSVKRTSEAILGSGEAFTYTATYVNRGGNLEGLQLINRNLSDGVDRNFTFSVSCGANTTEGVCPDWANGDIKNGSGNPYTIYDVSNLNLPAGATLELQVRYVHHLSTCTVGMSPLRVHHNTWTPTFPGALSEDMHSVEVEYTCSDVSTSTTVSVPGRENAHDGTLPVSFGENLNIAVDVVNAVGEAKSVPLKIQLPNIVKVDATVQPTCTAQGDATCPDPGELHYDPAQHAVVGTLPSIRDGKISVNFAAVADARGRRVLSSKVETTAPSSGDSTPSPGTLNPSEVTLGYIPETIAIPLLPAPAVVCSASGDAQWGVPPTEESVSWRLNGEGHLLVETLPAYIFRLDDGTLTRTHDYGTAASAGISCLDIPGAPRVQDECGAGNASWILPAESDTLTWAVNEEGHAVVTTKPGHTFRDNTVTHDYGVAPETNTASCESPTPEASASPSTESGGNDPQTDPSPSVSVTAAPQPSAEALPSAAPDVSLPPMASASPVPSASPTQPDATAQPAQTPSPSASAGGDVGASPTVSATPTLPQGGDVDSGATGETTHPREGMNAAQGVGATSGVSAAQKPAKRSSLASTGVVTGSLLMGAALMASGGAVLRTRRTSRRGQHIRG